jgi:hypothetical protein
MRRVAAISALAVVAATVSATAASAHEPQPPSAVAFQPGTGDSVAEWNRALLTIVKTAGAQPATVHPTYSYAIMHTAIYDTVVSITHADKPMLVQTRVRRQARPDAAADQAAHDTLVALYPTMQTTLDQILARQLAALPTGAPTQEGIRVGHLTAVLVLAARANDGSATRPPPFAVPPAQPGNYQITPPNNPAPAFTAWAAVTPFVLDNADQFRPTPPPSLTTDQWAQAINEVQSLGQDTSTTRTADETLQAKFWAPAIWNTWNQIADDQVIARRTNLQDTAKMLAELSVTLADTSIALYDAKYSYLFWRPITAIRSGTPVNAAVVTNPTWNAVANTAPDPSYPGAHSTFSAAAATVLADFFGDRSDITVGSDALTGVTRQFTSFQAVAAEAGLSRIFAGQHTRIDHDAGLILGRDVARSVLGYTEDDAHDTHDRDSTPGRG